MTYSRRIDRLSPALILMLVDQSESMTDTIGAGPASKAQAVADQINALLQELILRCVKTPRQPPRAYFYVDVIGYSTTSLGEPIVESALATPMENGLASTAVLAENPLRIERRHGASGRTINSRIWVEPIGRGGTPMCAAFDQAGRTAASWVARRPDTFPPVIVNLSDGEATDGDPAIWASRLRSLSTSDGGVLLFNLNMSTQRRPPVLFPADAAGLTDDFAYKLFHMSSPLPEPMVNIARLQGMAIRPGARGFVYNADIKALAAFLNVGTAMGRAAR